MFHGLERRLVCDDSPQPPFGRRCCRLAVMPISLFSPAYYLFYILDNLHARRRGIVGCDDSAGQAFWANAVNALLHGDWIGSLHRIRFATIQLFVFSLLWLRRHGADPAVYSPRIDEMHQQAICRASVIGQPSLSFTAYADIEHGTPESAWQRSRISLRVAAEFSLPRISQLLLCAAVVGVVGRATMAQRFR